MAAAWLLLLLPSARGWPKGVDCSRAEGGTIISQHPQRAGPVRATRPPRQTETARGVTERMKGGAGWNGDVRGERKGRRPDAGAGRRGDGGARTGKRSRQEKGLESGELVGSRVTEGERGTRETRRRLVRVVRDGERWGWRAAGEGASVSE